MSNSMTPMRIVRGMSQSLCIILLLTAFAFSAESQEKRVRNIVLVHGAWADGSGWKGVYDILVKDGFNVSIVQEPETSFQEDVAATKRVLGQQDGPCILVAHSLFKRTPRKPRSTFGEALSGRSGFCAPDRARPSSQSGITFSTHFPEATLILST